MLKTLRGVSPGGLLALVDYAEDRGLDLRREGASEPLTREHVQFHTAARHLKYLTADQAAAICTRLPYSYLLTDGIDHLVLRPGWYEPHLLALLTAAGVPDPPSLMGDPAAILGSFRSMAGVIEYLKRTATAVEVSGLTEVVPPSLQWSPQRLPPRTVRTGRKVREHYPPPLADEACR